MAPRMDRAAQRAELLRLGAAVAEEIRAGGAGAGMGALGDALAALPQAPLEIVGLIGREARRRQPDAQLVAALAFICGQALETLRFGVERADPAAAAMLSAVRDRLVQEARSDKADPAVLMLLTKQFAVAKLDIGAELRGAMGDMLDERADEAAEAGAGDADMARHLAELARQLGDDPFAIHAELGETASSFPIDHRLAMASLMLASDATPVREAALGWLFDPEPDVAPALCAALAEEAAAGRLGGATLRRLLTARNWFRPETRAGVDAVVRGARRGGAEPAPSQPLEIEELRLSGVDGSGAVSAFALARSGGRFAVTSLLFKFGHGVRDAWVQRGMSRTEARAQLDRVEREIDLVPVSLATLNRLLAHMLSLNAEGAPPPFGAVDAVEAMGLGIVNPQRLGPDDIVADLLSDEDAEVDEAAVLEDSAEWPARYAFMSSWFEDDAAVDAALAGGKRLSRARRADLVLEHVVAPRRRRWGELLAWMALVTAENGGREEGWRFATVARACLDGRPVGQVSLLRTVAEGTVEARRLRRG